VRNIRQTSTALSQLPDWLIPWPPAQKKYVTPNYWYSTARLHGVTTEKLLLVAVTAIRILNLL
jgi:hypothetical protein